MKKSFEITIPTNWDDVSIKMFMDYTNSVKEIDDDRQLIINTISTLCNIPKDVVEIMKIKDLKKIQEGLHLLLKKPVNKNIINKINIDGIKYGFHPKLDDMTMGEYVDIETYAKENDFAKMMSVLYRPIIKEQGNKYDIELYDFDNHSINLNKFEKLSINIGNPIAVFFWNIGKQLLKVSQQYLKQVEKNQSHKIMDGSQ